MDKKDYLFYGMTKDMLKNELYMLIDNALYKQYGGNISVTIMQRFKEEWAAIEAKDVFLEIGILYELVMWLKEKEYPYRMRYSAGASFILYLLGITMGNPLPPHSYCSKCREIQWKPLCKDGFDLQYLESQNDSEKQRCCHNDGTSLIYDGHDIPWQTLWGYGDSYLRLHVELLKNCYEEVRTWFLSHWLVKSPVQDVTLKVCDGYEDVWKQVGIGRVHCTFLLESERIGRNGAIVRDKKILQEWRSLIADEVVEDTNLPIPHTFSDLLAILGMLHGNGTLDESVIYMVETMGYSPSDMIVFRDDVYRYLRSYDWSEKNAWKGMERVRKGKGLQNVTQEMKAAPDKWVLDRCKRVMYLPAKADIVERLLFRLNMMKQ